MNQSILDDNKKKKDEILKRRSFEEKLKMKKRRRKINRIYNVFLCLFIIVFLYSAGYLLRYLYYSKKSAKQFNDLRSLVREDEYIEEVVSGDDTGTDTDLPFPVEKTTNQKGEVVKRRKTISFENVDGEDVQSKYADVYLRNHDFCGWLTIDDTSIDYPVMLTPFDEEKYLHTDFNGEYSFAGTLFCGVGSEMGQKSDNILIYGHNMKDGSMFHDLRFYFDQDYFESHKFITFNTIYGNATYEIFAVFNGQILNMDEEGFRYYNFYTAYGKEEFDYYVDNVRSRSVIDSSTSVSYGDHLLTLSTCASVGSDEGKRYVVVAKQISYEGMLK